MTRRHADSLHIEQSAGLDIVPMTEPVPEIEVYEPKSVIGRLQRILQATLSALERFTIPLMLLTMGVLWFVLSMEERQHVGGWPFSIATGVVFFASMAAVGTASGTSLQQWPLGKPVFAPYAGLPRILYAHSLRAAGEMKLEFEAVDLDRARHISDFDAELTECGIRYQIETERDTRRRVPMDDGEWAAKWQWFLDNGRVGRYRFADTIAEHDLSFNVVVPRFLHGYRALSWTTFLFSVPMIVFTSLYLDDRIPFVRLVQFGLVMSLVAASLVVLNHAYQPDAIPMNVVNVPPGVVDMLGASSRDIYEHLRVGGDATRLTPSEIMKTDGYDREVRNFYSIISFRGSLVFLVLVASLGVGLSLLGMVWTQSLDGAQLDWLARFLGILAAFLVGQSVVLFLLFVALKRLRAAVLVVGTAIAVALGPVVVEYVIHGEADVAQVSTAVQGLIGGLGAMITVALFGASPGRR